MSKKNIGPGQLNRTLPIRQLATRQERLISCLLEDSALQQSENNWRHSANVSAVGKEQLQLEELRREVQHLKDKDAVNRLTISKVSAENHQLKQELSETQHRMERQQGLMRADRVYIQTLDREVRRLKEMLQGSVHTQPAVDPELEQYEQENKELLAEIGVLIQARLNKTGSNSPCQPAQLPAEPSKPPSRSTSKKKPVLR